MTLNESERQAFGDFEKRGWEKAADPYHRHWGNLTRQSSEALLAAACVGAGSKVLDVATGAGYVAAAAHGRGAEVIGLDFSEQQVGLARKIYPGIEFRQGDAENLPFEAGRFDAVVMGLCLLPLPNAERGIAEALRLLRPGGYFASTVWAKPEDNPAFRIVLGALDRHGDKVDLPPAPPYFRFADAEEARRVLLAAGFVEPRTQVVPQYWRHASPDQLFDAFDQGAVRATAMLRGQPEHVHQRIREAVREEVLPLAEGGIYVIAAPVTFVGKKAFALISLP
jgi:ubiquinone/menaquinone biosynthesis C-methylase UbiE